MSGWVIPALRLQGGQGRQGNGDDAEAATTGAPGPAPMNGGSEKGSAGDIANNRQGSEGNLGGSIPPLRQFFLFELFPEHRFLDGDPFALLHGLTGSDHLHLAFVREETKMGTAVLADRLDLTERQNRWRRAIRAVVGDDFRHRSFIVAEDGRCPRGRSTLPTAEPKSEVPDPRSES